MFFSGYYRQCPSGTAPYVIRAGDTLSRIARLNNTTVQAIINLNPNINPNNLQIGQQICIPLRQQVYPSCPTTNYYVIQPGDTLESIAAYFNVSYNELLQANQGIDPNALYEDMYICIPVAPSPVSIEVNTATRTLTVFRDGNVYRTYPVAVGSPVNPTPKGTFVIVFKQIDPPAPYGNRLMGLSIPNLFIHSTVNPEIIGQSVTNGNIILNNLDISELFNLSPVGTTVRIV